MANALTKIYNSVATRTKNLFLLPMTQGIQGHAENIPQVKNDAHDPRSYPLPLQMQRIKVDVFSWRDAVDEAENAYYPHRFKMQRIFVDKILEGHTFSCMRKRKDLTILKDFCIGRKNTDGRWVKNDFSTSYFQDKKWFDDLLNNILDAQFFGYSLIKLGDLVKKGKDYDFKNLTILKRWIVSPDRLQLVQIPYQTWGLNFLNEDEVDENGVPFADWMVYVDTPSDTGASICGYGLLYNVALYAIILRNNLSHNADFNQLFASPYRHVKTPYKVGDEEYTELEQSMANMGNANYVITSDQEVIEFIDSATGTGFLSYPNLEDRCQKIISKIIGGHANFLDSQSTALGGGSSGKDVVDEDSTPEGKAMAAIEKMQDKFALNALNNIVLPKLRKMGFKIAEDECFYIPNDKEEFELRKKTDAANLMTASVWKMAKDGGLKLSSDKFKEITGIDAEEIEEPKPSLGDKGQTDRIQKKLKAMYKHG